MTDTMVTQVRRAIGDRGVVLVSYLAPVVALWVALMLSPVRFDFHDAVFALVVVAALTSGYTLTVTPAYADRWATARGARFDDRGIEVLTRHLARTRATRSLGVGMGLAAPLMAMAYYNANPDSFESYPEIFANSGQLWLLGLGFLVASVWAELTKPRLGTGTPTGATMLMRRRLSDFLDRFPRWGLIAYSALACATTLVALGYLVGVERPLLVWTWGRLWIVAPAVIALFCLVAAVVLCRRSERADDDAALAYEELTRTTTINALAGTVVAMLASYSMEMVGSVVSFGSSLYNLVTVVELVVVILALMIWVGSGTSLVFRTRRLDRLRSTA